MCQLINLRLHHTSDGLIVCNWFLKYFYHGMPHIILTTRVQQSLNVCEPQGSGFWPFMITHFTATVSTLCDWCWWIRVKPCGWWVGFITLTSVKLCLSFHKIHYFHALWNKILLQSFNVLYMYMYICEHVCIYTYIYMCVCVCVCVYVYMYVHT